ncbi:MAG: T9SS type A sorting domain-containing protein [Chitinophagaceae bacterium]|nr:T9SS type A sorting domain-containing protein [Chitinophagaceae bacterium]
MVSSLWSQITYTWIGASGASWTNSASWSPARAATANTDIMVFDNGATLIVVDVPTQTIGKIQVSLNTNVTLRPQTTGNRTLTVNTAAADAISVASGSTLTITGRDAGTDRTLTLTTANSAGLQANISGTIGVGLDNNQTNATGTFTKGGANATININSGGTYVHGLNGGTIPTATWNTNSTCNISGMTSTFPSAFGQTFGNMTFSSTPTGTITFGSDLTCNNLTISIGGANILRVTNTNTDRIITVNGDYSQTSGNFLLVSDNGDATLDVAGSFSVSGGTLDFNNDNGTGNTIVNVAGNFSHSAGTITRSDLTGSGTANIFFDGSAAQSFTSGGTVGTGINYTVNNGATLNMATAGTVVTGDAFTVAGGGTLGITSTDGIVTAPTNSGNIQTTARTFNTTGNYSYIGSGAQVTGNALPSTVNNFTINNAAGLNLTQDLGINGVMTFTSGVVNSNSTNTLTINDNATVTGASNSSYVDGFMVKVGNDNFTFPVGDPLGSYHPITLNNSVAANPSALVGDTYNAEYFRASALSLGPIANAAGLYAVSNCEYWNLNRTSGAGTPDIAVSWTADSPCGGNSYVTQTTGLVLAWLDLSNEWQLGSGGAFSSSGVPAAGTAQQVDVNQFGFFALGNTAPNANPLPVKIGSIKAYEKAAGVQIDWTAFTEINAEKYVIERSANGQQFTAIGEVTARNLSIASDYGFFDPNPLPGISFYRLRNLDQDGKSGYSNIVRVNLSKDGKSVIVYPNPVRAGGYLSYGSSQLAKGIYTARIFNAAGQQVYNQQFSHAGGAINQTIQLPAGMKAGLYAMQLNNEEITVSSKTFIVQ